MSQTALRHPREGEAPSAIRSRARGQVHGFPPFRGNDDACEKRETPVPAGDAEEVSDPEGLTLLSRG